MGLEHHGAEVGLPLHQFVLLEVGDAPAKSPAKRWGWLRRAFFNWHPEGGAVAPIESFARFQLALIFDSSIHRILNVCMRPF